MLHYQGLYMGAKGREARKPQARAIPGTGMGVGMGGRGGRGWPLVNRRGPFPKEAGAGWRSRPL